MYLWAAPRIEVVEPAPECCAAGALPPEGNVKLRNYRVLNENLRAYTPTGDVHTSPLKGKLVARYEVSATVSPPRARILELVRPEDPGRDALEAIVRPAPRRGLQRPLDDDARRFLQRALQSPSPGSTPDSLRGLESAGEPVISPEPVQEATEQPARPAQLDRQRSLADELREAEENRTSAPRLAVQCANGRERAAVERERLGRLALAVEEDEPEGALGAAARRLDRLLLESRVLHRELAAIHRDLQVLARRVRRDS